MTSVVAALAVALGLIAYLLPAILAGIRGHASAWGIFALNLLLGWSGIIWIIALIWALSNKGQPNHQTVIVNNHNNDGHQSPPQIQPIYIPVPQQSPGSAIDSGTNLVPQLQGDTRSCPSCAETIKAAAIKCRFCGERVSPTLLSHGPEVRHGE